LGALEKSGHCDLRVNEYEAYSRRQLLANAAIADAFLCGERRRLHDTASLPRALDRLDVMHAAAVPLRADLGAAWGGEAIDFALAPSKRWVSVPQRRHQHTASHPDV
jgi:hypothetical protein